MNISLETGGRFFKSSSPEETERLGEKWARELSEGEERGSFSCQKREENQSQTPPTPLIRGEFSSRIFLLFGEMGMGKTTFARGFARGLGIMESVQSPSYALLQEYALSKNSSWKRFLHADLWRADTSSALGMSEIMEYFDDPQSILLIEWAEKIPEEMIPEGAVKIVLKKEK